MPILHPRGIPWDNRLRFRRPAGCWPGKWLALCTALLVTVGWSSEVVMVTSFKNALAERKWDWIGFALEEACRRNIGKWEGVALYPLLQQMPDSASVCLQDSLAYNPAWGDLWRTDMVVGGRFHMAEKSAPNILFFHGNGEMVADYDEMGPLYNRIGINFLPVDYRGYGRSTGQPTITAMMRDCHVIFDFAKKWLA